MATSGKSSKSLSAARQAAPDSTDPQGLAAEDLSGDDELAVSANLDDKTQIINTNPHPVGPEFKLIVLAGPKAGAEFPVETEEFTVGRAVENIVSIPDVSVSRKHVKFVRVEDGFVITDLKSGNGTKINGKSAQSANVGHGDEVTLGDTVLQIIDLTKPLPERLKPINTLQSPSGQSAAPQATTEVEGAKLLPLARRTPAGEKPRQEPVKPPPEPPKQTPSARSEPEPTKPPPPPPKKPAPAKKPPSSKKPAPAGKNKRMRMYLAIGLVMVVGFMVANVVKKQSGPNGEANGGEDRDLPKQILEAREKVVKSHDWVGAQKLLVPLKGSQDPAVVRWLEAVPKEVEYQTKLDSGIAALDAFQFGTARGFLESIPEEADVYPQAQDALQSMSRRITDTLVTARQALDSGDHAKALELADKILSVDPTNEAAKQLKEEASRPVRVASKGGEPHPVKPQKTEPVVQAILPTAPPPPSLPFAGPWLTAYLNNQLKEALRLAATASDPQVKDKFSTLVTEFSANYTQGMTLAEGKHTLEALRYLQAALKIDAQIMQKRENQLSEDKPGREVRRQLSNIEYLLSLDSRSDDQLVTRTKHLKAALAADPSNELAKKGLNEAYDRAHAMFMQAYVMKGTDQEAAKRLFKVVAGTLPSDDEKQGKAVYWLNTLSGHPQQ